VKVLQKETEMIIKEMSDVPVTTPSEYKGVEKQILIGREDGSKEIILRNFSIKPGGASPYHCHGFPHLVKVERGQGVIVDATGREHPLSRGMVVYIPDNEHHGFKNTGSEPFDFLCIVPDRGEKV
jgi:quercetin dioxygenase-like cupin family protein